MTTKNKLHILWTNDNFITTEKMVFMYGINSKSRGWWEEVTLIIWGATVKLVAENKRIQELIEEAKVEGVHVTACKGCADQLGLTKTLKDLDIEVIYHGETLTNILGVIKREVGHVIPTLIGNPLPPSQMQHAPFNALRFPPYHWPNENITAI